MDERLAPYSNMHRWEWQGIVLLEPFTVITNLLIALMCFYAWRRLRKQSQLSLPQRLACWFFLLMGFATIVGGLIGHGLVYVTGQAGKLPGWMLSMGAVALFERSAIQQSRMLMKPAVGQFFSILNYVEIATLALLAIITLNFHFVELHAAYGLMVVVFSFTYYTWIKTKASYCKYFFMATLMGACAALFHALKIDLAYWFTYNDISHLFMVAGVWFYYKGVRGMPLTHSFALPVQG